MTLLKHGLFIMRCWFDLQKREIILNLNGNPLFDQNSRNHFNSFFISIVKELAKYLNPQVITPPGNIQLIDAVCNFSPTDVNELMGSNLILFHLYHIFIRSMELGYLRNVLKHDCFILICKCCSFSSAYSYRLHIQFLLSQTSTNYLENNPHLNNEFCIANNVLSNLPFGFLKTSNTIIAFVYSQTWVRHLILSKRGIIMLLTKLQACGFV